MTIERNRRKDRLTQPRLSDIPAVDADHNPSADRGPDGRFVVGNAAGAGARARHTLTRPFLGVVSDQVAEALGEQQAPGASRQVAREALTLYRSFRRDLPSSSVAVLGPALRYAINTALAGHYTALAGLAGFETDRGMQLVDLSHRCEQQALRASTAAITYAAKLSASRKPDDPWAQVVEAFGSDEEGDK